MDLGVEGIPPAHEIQVGTLGMDEFTNLGGEGPAGLGNELTILRIRLRRDVTVILRAEEAFAVVASARGIGLAVVIAHSLPRSIEKDTVDRVLLQHLG